MATTAERLQRLKYYGTGYELVAERDGQRILVAYCAKSRRMVLQAVRKRADAMVALTGAESIEFAKRASEGATMGEWRIHFSGRTQREAIAQGELPYVKTVSEG